MTRLTIRRPDDMHLHLRDGAMLQAVLPDSARDFGRAIIMPNLVPPVVTKADAEAYKARIMAALPEGMDFQPLMVLYLTETTNPDDVEEAFKSGLISAVKLYPAGATTNSSSGVTDFFKVRTVLERMAKIGLPLCVHGEVTDHDIDIFDREAVFIERIMEGELRKIDGLKITMEHVTTEDAVDYVMAGDENLRASITTHHLIINRNHILVGGIRPDYYCLPVAKREKHRLALRKAAVSGHDRFFLGTDSAPHLQSLKHTGCGCAGIYTSINTMACLAHVFEEEGALDKLEGFTSIFGAKAYGLQPSEKMMSLEKRTAPVSFPNHVDTTDGPVTVFDPGFPLYWDVVAR